MENGKKRKKINKKEKKNEGSLVAKIEDSRIIDIAVMQRNMRCREKERERDRDNNKPLFLEYLEKEERLGLASIFIIRCHTCLLLNETSLFNHY